MGTDLVYNISGLGALDSPIVYVIHFGGTYNSLYKLKVRVLESVSLAIKVSGQRAWND